MCEAIVQLYCTYSLYYPVLCVSLDLCATIVQLYCTYSFYYPVLRVSSNLCAASLCYFADMAQILHSLASLTQLVPDIATNRLPPLKSKWWRSRSVRPPSTVDPPALTCLHCVQQTNQAYQAFPSKTFLTNTTSALILTCPSKSFWTYTPIQAM